MFYRQTEPDQLTRAQMDMARKAFRGKLVRLRFSPQFVLNNADELLAIAHSEYVRAVQQGTEIEDPVAWTIHCAWRRTQNLLQAQNSGPRTVSSEKVGELVADDSVAPEEQAIKVDRARKIREAVAKLDPEQRKVIALTFFEDMSVREAARHLGWSVASVQRRRETALRTLRRFLPVRSGDDLAIDVGMACWLSLAASHSGFHLPAGFESVLDRAGHEASGIWGRAQDLARRLTVGGGETATAVASGGAGRAVGVCATGAAIVCLAGAGTGLVGPGIVGLGGGHPGPSAPPPQEREHQDRWTRTPKPKTAAVTPTLGTVAADGTEPSEARTSVTLKSTQSRRVQKDKPKVPEPTPPPSAEPARASAYHEEVTQVEEEVSGIARAGQESNAASQPAATASEEKTEAPIVVHKESSSAPATKVSAESEFNFEK